MTDQLTPDELARVRRAAEIGRGIAAGMSGTRYQPVAGSDRTPLDAERWLEEDEG